MANPIFLVGGTRPNFVKLAPVHASLSELFDEVRIVHTGQHYDAMMSQIFFDDLKIPSPDFFLGVSGGSHAHQTAEIMKTFDDLCHIEKPSLVVVFGDVNSTLACSLVAKKLGLPIAHVESGLRSGDTNMPEEVNRILTDHISDYLFATTEYAADNLISEGISKEKIHTVGNVMIDTIKHQHSEIENSVIVEKLGLETRKYNLLTLHRPSNVDNKNALSSILKKIKKINTSKKWVFPIHPRTKKKIEQFNFEGLLDGFIVIPPVGYNDFSNLIKNTYSVWTDSGGIQEECMYYGVPCRTIRENTERPETIIHGTNKLLCLTDDFEKEFRLLSNEEILESDYWDGLASIRIAEIIRKNF